MDKLTPLFNHFSPVANVFFTGTLCELTAFTEDKGHGHLHLIKTGRVTLEFADKTPLDLCGPALVFLPHGDGHRLLPDENGMELVCAKIDWGSADENPLARWLPQKVVLSDPLPIEIYSVVQILFAEAFSSHCGKQAALERLTEYVFIIILRDLIQFNKFPFGLLKGLSDPKISRAMTAMNSHPEIPWTTDSMAVEAGMSRTRFSPYFKQVTGTTPGEYLLEWRLGLAKKLLMKNIPLKRVASMLGYRSVAGLTKVFEKKLGKTPRGWLKCRQASECGDES